MASLPLSSLVNPQQCNQWLLTCSFSSSSSLWPRPLWSGFQAAIFQHVSRAMPAYVGTGKRMHIQRYWEEQLAVIIALALMLSAYFKDVPVNGKLEGGTCSQHFMSPIGALRYTCKGGQISIYLGVRAIRATKMSTWRKW